MAGNADTLYRQWTMLKLIPREPGKISTQDVFHRLEDEGYKVSDRTVARDLQWLSGLFAFTNETEGNEYSGPCRPLIPTHAGHLFRFMPATHSDGCRPPPPERL